MKKQTNPNIQAHLIRETFYLLMLVAICAMPFALAQRNATKQGIAKIGNALPTLVFHRTLTFAERVAYQRSIEEVYWRHRIWPKERSDRKPSLDAVMSHTQLEKKVADYLRKSQPLEDYWQRPITTEQLQAEMERMAQRTKQPEMLRELFEALGDDPFVIAECLARPAVSEHSVTNWYAYDQRFHGELKQHAEVELRANPTIEQMKQTSGKYSEIELVRSDTGHQEKDPGAEPGVKLNSREWGKQIQKLAAMFNKPTGAQRCAFAVLRHAADSENVDMSTHSENANAKADATIPIGKVSRCWRTKAVTTRPQ